MKVTKNVIKGAIVAAFIGLSAGLNAQSVGINVSGADPDGSAILDVSTDGLSPKKGVLVPRMNSVERNTIVNPANGLIIFNTDENCLNYAANGGVWFSLCGSMPVGVIGTLDCAGAVQDGTITDSEVVSDVSVTIGYTGGNGGTHNGQTVSSTGVLGLTATLSSGSFDVGAGTLEYEISGLPTGNGTASFALNIGGKSCTLELTVEEAQGCGTVTFTYKGNSVTYGTVVSGDNRCWLDRNLGASQVATSSSDSDAYGDLFQWGRLDDGHQDRSSSTTTTRSATPVPGNDLFIRHNQNWRTTNVIDDMWQGSDGGVNNPCPTGWRLPTTAEWITERDSWTSYGYESPLKLTYGGWREGGTGNLQYIGSGFYHSSSYSGTYYTSMFATEDGWLGGTSSNPRSNGASVRCIKD